VTLLFGESEILLQNLKLQRLWSSFRGRKTLIRLFDSFIWKQCNIYAIDHNIKHS